MPAAFLVPTGRAHWHVLMRARAIECQAYVVAPAQCGGHVTREGLKRETYGHSLVVGPWGEILGDAGGGDSDSGASDSGSSAGAALLVVDLTKEQIKQVRRQIPMSKHRRLAADSFF